VLDLLVSYAPAFLEGLRITATLTLITWSVGLLGGILAGAWAMKDRVAGEILKWSSLLFGALPILVVLMWLHFPAQSILGVVIDPFWTTAFALSLVNFFLVGDVVAKTLGSLPSDWQIAAKVSGLDRRQAFWRITLPLAARQLLGPLTVIQVTMLHATLFGSLISVDELFRTVQRINAIEYRPIELYTLLAGFFLIICAPLQYVAYLANRRFAHDLSVK